VPTQSMQPEPSSPNVEKSDDLEFNFYILYIVGSSCNVL
jgi:hypothetical protein